MDPVKHFAAFLLVAIVSPVVCHRAERYIISGALNCTLTPISNGTFVSHIYRYFDKDSSVRVIEYIIHLNGGGTLNWEEKASEESFQPWKWYRTQGVGSSRLLLLNFYYYGLLKPFTDIDTVEIELTLQVSPDGCLESIQRGDLDVMLSNYLLEDFNINENSVKHPFKYDDDVQICSMYIADVDGWGHLHYECCGYDDSNHLECQDVYEDDWVWSLRAFLITLSILLFLHFPSLIPKGYRTYTYVFHPPDDLTFNLRLTTKPELFSEVDKTTVLRQHEWRNMTNFKRNVLQLQPEVTYTAHVQSAHFRVSRDRLLTSYSDPISVGRYFFDFLVRCKVRHSDPFESCCRTSICGEHDRNCPPWHAWLRALRTISLMFILALPAVPLLYAISADNLDYQTLVNEIEDRGLARTYNFFPGLAFGRVITGILAFMYVLNTIIVVIDGATNSSIAKMYTAVLEVSEKRASLGHRIAKGQSVIKKAFVPIKKYGLVILPLWIIFIALLPLYGIILYIVHAPLIKILIHAFKRLMNQCVIVEDDDPDNEEKCLKFCEMFWFFITLVFVFIVLTLGINFLIHVVALILIKILIDEQLVYHVFPVVLLLVFYLRDSFKTVIAKYAEHQRVIIDTLKHKNEEDLRKRSLEVWCSIENQMFAIPPSELSDEPEPDEHAATANVKVLTGMQGGQSDTWRAPFEMLEAPENYNLFVVRYGHLRMRLQQVLLFLNSRDILQMSKKFLFDTCTMDCPGSPGPLEKNFIRASLDFLKVATFLIFVFLVVMAYGNAYYISPANHIFITLVSGILPLLLRNVLAKPIPDQSMDTKSIRFETQFNQKIHSFQESWELEDISLDKFDFESVPYQVTSLTNYKTEQSKRRSTVLDPNTIDLVLDVSSEQAIDPHNRDDLNDTQDSRGSRSYCCCCRHNKKRRDVVEEGDDAATTSVVPSAIELAQRRPSWKSWSEAKGIKPSGKGPWQDKGDKDIYIDEIFTTTSRPHNASRSSLSPLSSDEDAAARASVDEALQENKVKVPAFSSQRPFKSSSEFHRFSPYSGPNQPTPDVSKQSVSDMSR